MHEGDTVFTVSFAFFSNIKFKYIVSISIFLWVQIKYRICRGAILGPYWNKCDILAFLALRVNF